MGSIIFTPRTLGDSLSETAGYKSGLALSIDEICDHLSGTEYPDLIQASEAHAVRVRAEDYEDLFYKLLHRVGYTKEEYDDYSARTAQYEKYSSGGHLNQYEGVLELLGTMFLEMLKHSRDTGHPTLDPEPFLIRAHQQYGDIGLQIALEQIEWMDRSASMNPHSHQRATEWHSAIELRKLFQSSDDEPEVGRFIDQRFINYLSTNPETLSDMHWRKFEQLAAEFFHREGFQVELGPGRNDGGVDVRIWKPDALPTDNPLCLVQCKRQKAKVQKVVVKGLYSDVQHEGAAYGVVVTTSELSPGARTTIAARGYPIREIERSGLLTWLTALRTPGTGIVRV